MVGAAGFFVGGMDAGVAQEEAKASEDEVIVAVPLPVDIQVGAAIKRLCPFAEPFRQVKRFKGNPQEGGGVL